MKDKRPGRPPKYCFLVDRLEDKTLYCAATIARLLSASDLRERHFERPLEEVRTKARMALARIARFHPMPPSGIVHLLERNRGNAYPGYKGFEWKIIFKRPGYPPYLPHAHGGPLS